jgi:hypothetical protein
MKRPVFLEGKGGRYVGFTTLTLSRADCKPENFTLLVTSGPLEKLLCILMLGRKTLRDKCTKLELFELHIFADSKTRDSKSRN